MKKKLDQSEIETLKTIFFIVVKSQFIDTPQIAKKIQLSTEETLKLCKKLQQHTLILSEMRDEDGHIYENHKDWENRYAYTWSPFLGLDEESEEYQQAWDTFVTSLESK